jgi:hypothetical protein
MTIQEAGDILDKVLNSDIAKRVYAHSGTGKYSKENLSSISQMYRYEGRNTRTASYTIYFNFGFTGKNSPRNVHITVRDRTKADKMYDAGRIWLDHLNISIEDEIDI